MLNDRRGADLVEWIVGVIIVIGIVGSAVYAVLQTLGDKFWELNAGMGG
jgi:hypothetical protein